VSDLAFFGALAAILVVAFLIGSIPFGYLIGRFVYKIDIRKSGSGNIGAMNALRTMGKGGAIAVLLLDALKGFGPVFLIQTSAHFKGDLTWTEGGASAPVSAVHILASVVALATVLGHCFSPWLGWKGGKGVATSFGAIFAFSWQAGLVAVGGWIAGALITQYSSVGSMFGSVLAPVALWFFTGSLAETLYGAAAALLIVFMHRENIGRLRAGTEGAISFLRRK
jgi:acyl phosphate:glycerol-3-phosphate acyltransferase